MFKPAAVFALTLGIASIAGLDRPVAADVGPVTWTVNQRIAYGVRWYSGSFVNQNGPEVVNYVLANPTVARVRPILSGGKALGLTRTSTTANTQAAAVAAVNGDMWGMGSTAPLGLHVQDGEVCVSGRHGINQPPTRATLGIDSAGRLYVGNVQVRVRVDHPRGSLTTDQINSARKADEVVLYTPRFAGSTHTVGGVEVSLAVTGRLTMAGVLTGTVIGVSRTGNASLSGTCWVLSGTGLGAAKLAGLVPGTAVTLTSYNTAGGVWNTMSGAIGGDQFLVRGGSATPVVGAVHPRTSVGIRADGRLMMVTVDGRQSGWSTGLTSMDMARLMLNLGAIDAVGCDGGGSTVMAVKKPGATLVSVVNRPSDGRERAVTNSLVVLK